MTWQKKARLAIAVFVLLFVAAVVAALRRPEPPSPVDTGPRLEDKEVVAQTTGGLTHRQFNGGKLVFTLNAETQLVYAKGRSVYKAVRFELPDRNGRTVTIASDEAEVLLKDGTTDVASAHLTRNVKLTTSDGVVVTAGEATYTSADGIVIVPGAVAFSKGRMSGTGVGATYDQGRQVLWLLDKAAIRVAPDDKGEGALDATAGAAGLASADHYVQLTKGGQIQTAGRHVQADDITIRLTPDNERVQLLQLRVNSRITGAAASAQSMTARDIDLAYAEDGRTLQSAKLVDNAVVQLPGEGSGPGRRIAARTIDMTMAPDGATLTGLVASENVNLDLPPEPGGPDRRIRSARLEASGAAGAGLQAGTFTGNVEYRETRAAQGGAAAVDRIARALRLVIETKPGLGAIQQADFRGNVHIVDAPDVTAQAQRAIYRVTADRIDLSPGEGDPGPQSQVTDGRATVVARTIELTLGGGGMKAETDVRSTLKPASSAQGGRGGPTPAKAGGEARVPAMLNQNEPVNVTSNRLNYDRAAALATYSGNATLWQQDGNRIQAATIVIDDKNGNLTAREGVRTFMNMSEVDPKTKTRKTSLTSGRSEIFTYDDGKRLATYTTKAMIDGPQGHVTADKIDLFLAKETNDLQRAEAHGTVTVREGQRVAHGTHLTYTAADDQYVMTGAVGTPVVVIEDKPSGCEHTEGTRLMFRRSVEHVSMESPVTRPCRPGDPR